MTATRPAGLREAALRGFVELQGDVIDAGICTECRACVDLCTADGPDALTLDLGKFSFAEDRCTGCGLCYAVCPEVPWARDDLAERYGIRETEIGRERGVASAVTRSPTIRSRSADGGVVTSLLWYLLDTGQIDGAILSRGNGPIGSGWFVARTKGEILQASGTRTGRGASLATGTEFVTNLDMIAFLRELYHGDRKSEEQLALVGTPCQAYAVRRMQQVSVAPAPRITTILGLFCFEALPLNKINWRRFEDATGLRVEDVERVRMGEELVLTLRDGRTERVDLETASLLAGPNCLRCADFSNRFADIALGAAGSDPGFTTALVRTERGHAVFMGALDAGYVSEWGTIFEAGAGDDPKMRLWTRLAEQTKRKVDLVRSESAKIESR